MTRVVAFVPDLLFGSQVQGSLRAAGHEVALVGDEEGLRVAVTGADVLVVDLTDDLARRVGLLDAISREGLLGGVRTLAFYSHVDVEARRAGETPGSTWSSHAHAWHAKARSWSRVWSGAADRFDPVGRNAPRNRRGLPGDGGRGN